MVATYYYTWFILFYIIFGTSICVEAQSTSLFDTGDGAGAETGDFIDAKLERLLQKIGSQLQTKITEKLDKITRSEFDHVKEITYKMLLEHTTNITQQINNNIDSAFKETKIFESSEITNQKLDAIHKKIEKIEINKNKEIKELVNKINELTTNNEQLNKKIKILTTNIQQLDKKTDLVCNEKTISELIGITNKKLGILENTTNHEEHYIKKLFETSEQIVSRETDMLKSIKDISKKIAKIENIPKLQQNIETLLNISKNIVTLAAERNNQTKEVLKNNITQPNDSKNGKIVSLCDVTVPSSVQIRNDIWKEKQPPAEDDLDRFMINKTGCSYKAVKYYDSFYLRATFDGTLYEWRGAVRGQEGAIIYVWWGAGLRFKFWIGYNDNKQTSVFDYSTSKTGFISTPGILSPERYEYFYVRIRAGTLTFGRECDRAPLYIRDVTVPRGEEVKTQHVTFSLYGRKFLVDCPANVAGQAGA